MRDAPTSVFDPWDRLDDTRRALYERGEAAAQVLRKYETIERWHEVGDAAAALMDDAMTYGRSNIASGRHYNAAWKQLSQHVPTVRDLDKSARSAAVWMSQNWADIDVWLKTLPSSERLKLNHPTVVRRRYDAAHRVDRPEIDDKPMSPQARTKQELVAAIERGDRLERELARRDAQDNAGSLFDLKAEKSEVIARVIVNNVSESKARGINKDLAAAIKAKWSRPKAPAG